MENKLIILFQNLGRSADDNANARLCESRNDFRCSTIGFKVCGRRAIGTHAKSVRIFVPL